LVVTSVSPHPDRRPTAMAMSACGWRMPRPARISAARRPPTSRWSRPRRSATARAPSTATSRASSTARARWRRGPSRSRWSRPGRMRSPSTASPWCAASR